LRNREEAESTLNVEDCYATLKLSLLVNITQAIRAVLFANAIAATLM
jgi:hypothetical protein